MEVSNQYLQMPVFQKVEPLQFGQQVEAKPVSWKEVAGVVSKLALLALTGAFIGGLIAGIPGAVLGTEFILKGTSMYLMESVLLEKSQKLNSPLLKIDDPQEVGVGAYTQVDMRVLDDASSAAQWKKELILSAESSIEISCGFGGGETFQEMLQCIQDRLGKKEKLQVHLTVCDTLLVDRDKVMLKDIKATFPHRFHSLITTPARFLGNDPHIKENHVKLLVIDEKYFQLGGTNMNSRMNREDFVAELEDAQITSAMEALDPCTRDLDIAARGDKLAKCMRRQFYNLFYIYESWQDHKTKHRFFDLSEGLRAECKIFDQSEGLIQGVKMKALCSGPEHRHKNPITNEYVKRIQKASKSVYLASLFFRPGEKIQKALRQTEAKVTCIVNGDKGSRLAAILRAISNVFAARSFYHLAHLVFEYGKPDTQYHRKIGLFDEGLNNKKYAIVGSYNLSKKSAQYDHEIAVVCADTRVYDRVLQTLQDDIAKSTYTKPDPWYYLPGRIITQLVENFF